MWQERKRPLCMADSLIEPTVFLLGDKQTIDVLQINGRLTPVSLV